MLQKGRQLAGGARLEAELGPDRMQQMRLLLTEGKSVKECARVVLEEWKVMASYKASTIITMIYRYTRSHVAAEITNRIRNTVLEKGTYSVSTIEDMKELVEMQRRRVLKSIAFEERTAFISTQTNSEMRLMADMLRNLAAVQIEVGILPRAAKTIKGVVMGEDGKPTVFGWIENDEQLLQALTHEIEGKAEPDYDDPQ